MVGLGSSRQGLTPAHTDPILEDTWIGLGPSDRAKEGNGDPTYTYLLDRLHLATLNQPNFGVRNRSRNGMRVTPRQRSK